jgi:hypothetical protein
VLIPWRAFLFLGLRRDMEFSSFFLYFAWWFPLLFLEFFFQIFYGQIDLNLEVCISNIMCTGQ